MIHYSGIWGGVCGWSLSNADVVCRQLGYRGALNQTTLLVETHTQPTWYWIESVNCTGNEQQLSDCSFKFSVGNCSKNAVAMVTCDGKKIKLSIFYFITV